MLEQLKEAHRARREWFLNQIGKRLWRTRTTCDCESCNDVYENGLIVSDKDHAIYLHDCEAEMGLKYFETKQERDEYEIQVR